MIELTYEVSSESLQAKVKQQQVRDPFYDARMAYLGFRQPARAVPVLVWCYGQYSHNPRVSPVLVVRPYDRTLRARSWWPIMGMRGPTEVVFR